MWCSEKVFSRIRLRLKMRMEMGTKEVQRMTNKRYCMYNKNLRGNFPFLSKKEISEWDSIDLSSSLFAFTPFSLINNPID